jgi:ubiquinone/menaquinone biosynthesis C-methylase UbiE
VAWSRTYDSEDNPLLLAEQPAVEALLRPVAPGRALDAACGTGRITRLLAVLGHRVTGIDVSEAMLEQARRALPGAEFRRAPLHSLPFDSGAFELVTCALSLTHVTPLAPVIAELARVLRPGGRLVTSDVHPFAVTTGAHAFLPRADGTRAVVRNEVHWHSEYVDAFLAAGLRVTRCVEPVFSDAVLGAFLHKGSTPANENLVGLPYVLIWECTR